MLSTSLLIFFGGESSFQICEIDLSLVIQKSLTFSLPDTFYYGLMFCPCGGLWVCQQNKTQSLNTIPFCLKRWISNMKSVSSIELKSNDVTPSYIGEKNLNTNLILPRLFGIACYRQ
jgi:hypothetical protein